MHIFEGKSYVVFCFKNLYGYDTINSISGATAAKSYEGNYSED